VQTDPTIETRASQPTIEKTHNDITVLLLLPLARPLEDPDIDTNRFMVKIFAPNDGVVRDEYEPAELAGLGVGTIHPNLEEAVKATPKGLA
jgi:hypothetical protein